MLIGDGNGEDDNGGEDSALWKNVKTTFVDSLANIGKNNLQNDFGIK